MIKIHQTTIRKAVAVKAHMNDQMKLIEVVEVQQKEEVEENLIRVTSKVTIVKSMDILMMNVMLRRKNHKKMKPSWYTRMMRMWKLVVS